MKTAYLKIRTVALVLLAGIVLLAGCKKTEEEATRTYLSGAISINLPQFVYGGKSFSFKVDTLSTLYREDKNGGVGIYIRLSNKDAADTVRNTDGSYRAAYPDGVYTFTTPEKTGRYTVTITGFATDSYYSSSGSAVYTVVDPATSVEGMPAKFDETVTDSRDGRQYRAVKAGDLLWMQGNLAWSGSGYSYNRCDAMDDIFGRCYTWTEAMTACPEGWRLPTDAEFKALAGLYGGKVDEYDNVQSGAGSLMGDLYFNGSRMWEYWPAVKITNKSGFSAMPVGYGVVSEKTYKYSGYLQYACFWTSDSAADNGVYRYIYLKNDALMRGEGNKTGFCASVRCVR